MFTFKNWKTVIAGLPLLLLTTIGCASPSLVSNKTPTPGTDEANPSVVLKISGSGGTTLILAAIAPAFEADSPGFQIKTLTGTGTGGGVKGVMQGLLDAAAMARPPKDKELAQDLEYVQFGNAGMAVYAHPDVGLTNLTTEQTEAIFSGQITNWSEVGGPNQEIVLYIRDEEESGTKLLRRETTFGNTPFSETAQVITSQGDMIVAIAGTPGSIGYGTWPTVLATKSDVAAIALDGITPDDSAYPLVGPLGIGYLPNRKADVQPLIDWLLSERGQAALRDLDVILME